MAVQKSRVTRSRAGMRRSHDNLAARAPALSTDKETGEIHLRHHVTASGFYRGRQMIEKKATVVQTQDEE